MTNLIIINGPMGAGKSTTSQLLAEQLEEKNYYLKMDDLKYNFSRYNDNREQSHQTVYKLAYAITETCLKQGISVIVDKVINQAEPQKFITIGEQSGAVIIPILFINSLENCINRVKMRREKAQLSVDEDYLTKVRKSFDVSTKLQGTDKRQLYIDTSNMQPKEVVEIIMQQINKV